MLVPMPILCFARTRFALLFTSHAPLQGWVSGTGGGISVRAGDKIVMAPSGVQKERMVPEDMFVLDASGCVVHALIRNDIYGYMLRGYVVS